MLENKNTSITSLDDLQTLLADIRSGKTNIKLGKRSLNVLIKMIEDPEYCAFNTITQIAKKMGVHASTLSRLSKNLGFNRFTEFQILFRNKISKDSHFYSDKLNRLLNEEHSQKHQNLSLLVNVAHDETSNISTMLKNIKTKSLDELAQNITIAKNIRIHGLRQFYSLSCFLSYGLGMIRNNVDVLGDSGHGVVHSLAQLNQDDLLIVIGAKPYTRATIDACRIAIKHDLTVIALTDSPASPLAVQSRYSIVLPIEGHYFGNNVASWFIFAEGLLAVVANLLGEKSIQALKHRERLINEFGIAADA